MSRNKWQDLFKALLIVGLSLLAIEVSLRIFDPWGMIYFEDVTRNGLLAFRPDPARGYVLNDGVYQSRYSQSTIQNGRRVVPNTQPADCTLAFLGDSVTFGAAPDDLTFVNLIARQLPDVEVLNYAVARYNSENVARTRLTETGHDAYIYIIFSNDGEPIYHPETDALVGGYQQPWLLLYTKYALGRTAPPAPVDLTRVNNDLNAMLDAGRTWLVAFADDVLTDAIVSAGYDVHIIPYPEKTISVVDFHPNVEGNAEIARDLLPFVQEIVRQAC